MALGWRVDEESGIVVVTGTGELTVEDLAEHREARLAGASEIGDKPVLWDVRAVEGFDVSVAQLRELARAVRDLGDAFGTGPVAVVVSTDLGYGFTRMFHALSRAPREQGVFRELDEAMAWLAERSSGSG